MKDEFFLIWFLATATDAIGALLAAVLCFKLGTRFGKFAAVMLLGVAAEAVIAAASLLLLWPHELSAAPAFAITRGTGRTIKALCVWALTLYLLGFFGREKRDERETTLTGDSHGKS